MRDFNGFMEGTGVWVRRTTMHKVVSLLLLPPQTTRGNLFNPGYWSRFVLRARLLRTAHKLENCYIVLDEQISV